MADPNLYTAGYNDAADLTSLFDDADPDYRAGWLAYWEAQKILADMGKADAERTSEDSMTDLDRFLRMSVNLAECTGERQRFEGENDG